MPHDTTAPPAPSRRLLIDLIAMLAIGLVVVVGYKLSPLLAPRADVQLTPGPGCNLHRGTCTVALDGGELEIGITPRPIPLIAPLVVEARAVGVKIKRIDADFAGVGMNMGYNRPQLLPVGAAADGLFRAETSLPVCITGTMNWELSLMVETAAGQRLIPIRFGTPEHGLGS